MNRCPVLLLVLAVASQAKAQPMPPGAAKPDEVIKAESLYREGKLAEAFQYLQDAVKKNTDLPPARLLLARMHFSAGQNGPGRQMLELAINENSQHPEVYLSNASQALAEGRFTDTVLNCQQALALANSDRWSVTQKKTFRRESHSGLAAAFEARKDWDSARTHLLAMLEFDAKHGGNRQRLARALMMTGKDTEAFNELQQAVRDNPTLEPAEVVLARLWALKGEPKQAEEWFEKAVQKYPQDARPHRAYGGWLLDHGRIDAARIHIDAAVKIDPKARDGVGLRGLLARYQKDFATAAKVFDEILREEPGNFYASNHLALASVELPERRARAIQLAEVNARQYPRHSDALATLGWVYFKTGRLDDAERALNASASSGQVSSDTAYYLARLLTERGKKTEARELLKKAVESVGPFVNRQDARTFLDELNKKP